MKLFGTPASPYTRKVRIVLAEKKIDYDFEQQSPWEPKSAVAGKNPLGKVPVLELEDGTVLYDSRVIVEFLDNASPNAKLIPADKRERVEVRRWEALADGVLDAGVLVRQENLRSETERSRAWIERQTGKVQAGLATMNRELGERQWCAGNAYSLADIAVGACLGWLSFRFPNIDWRSAHANLARGMDKLSERQSFIDTVPRA